MSRAESPFLFDPKAVKQARESWFAALHNKMIQFGEPGRVEKSAAQKAHELFGEGNVWTSDEGHIGIQVHIPGFAPHRMILTPSNDTYHAQLLHQHEGKWESAFNQSGLHFEEAVLLATQIY